MLLFLASLSSMFHFPKCCFAKRKHQVRCFWTGNAKHFQQLLNARVFTWGSSFSINILTAMIQQRRNWYVQQIADFNQAFQI